jgi:hypothetical protein
MESTAMSMQRRLMRTERVGSDRSCPSVPEADESDLGADDVDEDVSLLKSSTRDQTECKSNVFSFK